MTLDPTSFFLGLVGGAVLGLITSGLRGKPSSPSRSAPSLSAPYPVVTSGEGMEQVTALIIAGQKIMAIKAYREMHPGLGLKEAKDAVEAMEARLKQQ